MRRSNLDWNVSDLMLSFGATGFYFFRFLYGDQARFFNDEIHIDLKHSKTGTVAMASAGENMNASQV
ncbi:peptidyl-prolyl cis-trans isomerase-like 4-like [Trifolium medium]|uniref:Peptidyl-prolyl cis-trans isomerase-like 4-like n=1 Tax=Trifolium medium TaxID=97028 RepID=A0A392Q432_9FABA|nr:peptidyl-prolyl cis-trans isomerase-like 4-like [Trifolium medium]